MSVILVLAVVPLGQILDRLPRAEQEPPKVFAEGMRLPAKPPAAASAIHGTWRFGYELDDAWVGEANVALEVDLAVQFDADGTYRLVYDARWGNPPGRGKDARGVRLDETGTYRLSGDVLLLDPAETMRAESTKTKAESREPVRNEKHVFVVHWESKRIHLAGRCASYLVDPVCKDPDVEHVWFALARSRKSLSR